MNTDLRKIVLRVDEELLVLSNNPEMYLIHELCTEIGSVLGFYVKPVMSRAILEGVKKQGRGNHNVILVSSEDRGTVFDNGIRYREIAAEF